MEFQDRILRCVDCGAEFVWTAGEQQFFADKNFKNEPKRCKACKGKRAQPSGRRPCGGARAGGNRHARARPAARRRRCPFRPTQGRPVFCKECFQSRKFAGAGGVQLHASVNLRTRARRIADVRAMHRAERLRGGGVLSSHAHYIWSVSMQIEERTVGDVVVLDLKGRSRWARATSCSRTRSTASSTRVTGRSC